MTAEQFLFVKAIDAYKRVNQRPFPTWTEVLEVMRKLGVPQDGGVVAGHRRGRGLDRARGRRRLPPRRR